MSQPLPRLISIRQRAHNERNFYSYIKFQVKRSNLKVSVSLHSFECQSSSFYCCRLLVRLTSSNIAVWGPERWVFCGQWTADTRCEIDSESTLTSSSSSWDIRWTGCCRRSARSFVWCPSTCSRTDDESFADTAPTRQPSRCSAATTSPWKSSWGLLWTWDCGSAKTCTGRRSTNCVSRVPSLTTSSVTTKRCGLTASTCWGSSGLIRTSGFLAGPRIEQTVSDTTSRLLASEPNTWNDSESSILATTTFSATHNAALQSASCFYRASA